MSQEIIPKNPNLSKRAQFVKTVAHFAIGALIATPIGTAINNMQNIETLLREQSPQEVFLSSVASNSITHNKMLINCTPRLPRKKMFSEELNVAKVEPVLPRTVIPPILHVGESLCDNIVDYSMDKTIRQNPDILTGLSIYSFAHEANHYRLQTVDEAAATCATLQDLPEVAKALGASQSQADVLFEQQAEAYEKGYYLPQRYLSTECHDGGELDLDPNNPSPYFPR